MKSFYEIRKERALVCKKIEDEIEKKMINNLYLLK